MLIEWMAINEIDERERSLLFVDFLTKSTYHKNEKKWEYKMGVKSIS